MQQLFELFFKNGLRPLSVFPDTSHLELQLTSSDFAALLLLKFHEQLTMSQMADFLGAPLSTVTSIAKRLVRKGYIYREKSQQDQRIIVNRLTEDGELIAEEALGTMNKMFGRIESALSAEELQQFIRLSLKVAKALQHNAEPEEPVKSPKLRSIEIE
ncbi:MarR family winged helix-turn-helix transcriptional regulator [Paenibacillus sp. GCM10023248]|uniref:MarR family winged helix-turn-helix transcriptional regulator n=1 Tax=Bacillales TaxID=1385 RepID=UPI0023783F21|nr:MULTISPECIES: MarR family transcriptional regulator [Bacillales]MDD9266709.1 MarR family transcriptional regulator [Paenibacillus sp. MAHUQ-63]MDR6883655.1 DNA-binding MarR family transcriptional regulator [Bacillus sp. 3255]